MEKTIQASESERLRAEIKRLKAQTSSYWGKDSKGQSNRKYSESGYGNKGNRFESTRPYELRGIERTYKGVPICFGYNCQSGCP